MVHLQQLNSNHLTAVDTSVLYVTWFNYTTTGTPAPRRTVEYRLELHYSPAILGLVMGALPVCIVVRFTPPPHVLLLLTPLLARRSCAGITNIISFDKRCTFSWEGEALHIVVAIKYDVREVV